MGNLPAWTALEDAESEWIALGNKVGGPRAQKKGWQFGGTGASTDMGDGWLRGVFDLTPWASMGPMTANPRELSHNAIVMACIQWVMRTFPEAPIQVRRKPRNKGKAVDNHGMVALIENPNPYYSSLTLWQSTVASYNLDGNAYWLKMRNDAGQVIELWYEPHTTIKPVGNDKEFISHYEVYRHGFWYRIEREDVVHFRFGQDDENPRKGLSPLKAALREVFTDQEASVYTASILKNMGVAGVIISPKTGSGLTPKDAQDIKTMYMQKTQGERRGEPLVWTEPLDAQFPSLNPQNMNLRDLRKIPQENISGLLGVAAIVAGLGAGLDRSTFANMAEAREYSYEGNIIPAGASFGATLDTHLLNDFGDNTNEYSCFDYSNVRVLQEDQNKLAARLNLLYNGNLIKRNEARDALNYKTSKEEDGYKNEQAGNTGALPGGDNAPGDGLGDPNTGGAGDGAAQGDAGGSGSGKGRGDTETKAKGKPTAASLEAKIEAGMKARLEDLYGKIASAVEDAA